MSSPINHAKAKYDVFFSYNSRDREQIEEIARRLTELGIKVFLDRWYLTPGFDWHQCLEQILATCGAGVVFQGRHGFGACQKREQSLALARQLYEPNLPVIPVLLPGADREWGFLFVNTWIDFREGISDARTLTLLAEGIRGKPPGPNLEHSENSLSKICPYRGLRIFREEHAPFFFGREEFIKQLVAMVQSHSFVAVVGPSGSGKSSVAQAGLLPRLRRGVNDQVWDVVTMSPGDSPLRSLAGV